MYKTYKKKLITITTILLICLITLGYSVLATTLNINGSSAINKTTWDVHFENIQVDENSVSAPVPTINTTKDTVNFSVTLNELGDSYEFTVDVKNTGTIDAMINTVSKTNLSTNQAKYINFSVTYMNGEEIASKHVLNSNQTETYKVKVEFKKDIQASDLNTNGETLNLSFRVDYVQKTNEGILSPSISTIYTIDYPSSREYTIGQRIPSDAHYYLNYNDAIINHNSDFFLKHNILNNTVTESYVGIKYNGNVIYLKGGDNGSAYATNKTTLLSAFGSDKCSERVTTTYIQYWCIDPISSLIVDAFADGRIDVRDDNHRYCAVDSDGTSNCGLVIIN